MLAKRATGRSIAVLLLLLLAPALAEEEHEPTPEEEKELAVKLAMWLEVHPFHEKAKEARSWLTMWLINVPDVSVKACSSFPGPYLKQKGRHSTEVFTQMLYGQAAFIVQNPDQSSDEVAVYGAGLASSLRAYESILQTNPRVRDEYLDRLVEMMDAGRMNEYVRSKMQDCQ